LFLFPQKERAHCKRNTPLFPLSKDPLLQPQERVFLFWAVFLLLIPLKWLIAAAAAAIIHEGFHIAAVHLLGGSVCRVYITPLGSVIETEGLSGLQEALCAVAGPLGSLLLLLLIRRFPVLGICALVQGGFNLLPVYPLDGGRVLLRLLEWCVPDRAEAVCTWIESMVLCLLVFAACAASVWYSMGIFPVLFVILAITKALLRKRP